jgi:hypothetical protein
MIALARDPGSELRRLALLGQILATRSLNRSSHKATQVLTVPEWTESRNWTESREAYEAKRSAQAELAIGEAEEARPDGHSDLKPSSDGLAVSYVAEWRQLPIAICQSQERTQSC